MIAYVLKHPEKFTPLAENTNDPIQNEWASKMNGLANFRFMRSFREEIPVTKLGRQALYSYFINTLSSQCEYISWI